MKIIRIQNIKRIVAPLLTSIEKILRLIGETINQVPTQEENKKAMKGLKKETPFDKNRNQLAKREKKPRPKSHYSFKGSSHNGKGGVNKETRVFNHPRKGLPPGRSSN